MSAPALRSGRPAARVALLVTRGVRGDTWRPGRGGSALGRDVHFATLKGRTWAVAAEMGCYVHDNSTSSHELLRIPEDATSSHSLGDKRLFLGGSPRHRP